MDTYAFTSEGQRSNISSIIAKEPKQISAAVGKPIETEEVNVKSKESKIESKACSCTCGASSNVNVKNIGMIIDNMMSDLDQKGKITIKMEIEVTKGQ